MTFREWSKQIGIEKTKIVVHTYYTEEQLYKDIETYNNLQSRIISHNTSLDNVYNCNLSEDLIHIKGNIIDPMNIILNSTDIYYLNKEYNRYDLYFKESLYLFAEYDSISDVLIAYIPSTCSKLELEAVVTHEMVLKKQHKWRCSSENENYNYFDSAFNYGNIIFKSVMNRKFRDELRELDQFKEVALAFNIVKEYSNKYNKPNEIINYMIENEFHVSSSIKKYVAMYWLIKDKIKGE